MTTSIPTGYSKGFPTSVWNVGELVNLIGAVITGSSAPGSFSTVTATGLASLAAVTATGAVTLSNASVKMTALPTADPHVVGALWKNSAVLTVSAG